MEGFVKHILIALVSMSFGSGIALADDDATQESERVVIMTLADWLDTEDGQRTVAEMLEQEAGDGFGASEQNIGPEIIGEDGLTESERRQAQDAIADAIEQCGIQVGNYQPMVGDEEADVSLNYSISLDDLFDGNFSGGTTTLEAGSGGIGASINVATLWQSPEDTAACVEMQMEAVYDRLVEEATALADGDYTSLRKLAGGLAMRVAVERAYEIDQELGEALDMLVQLSTMKDPC